jgi:putative FmdB family regulatory protein
MPIYEYECSNCRYYLEVIQKLSEARLKKCPSCGKSALKKLISAPVFRLKGSGWYETDFKGDSEKKRNLAGAEKEETSSSAKDAKDGKDAKAGTSETSGDSKAAAPSEAKSDAGGDTKPAKSEPKASGSEAAPGKADARKSRTAAKPASRSAPAKRAASKPPAKAGKRRGRR